MNTHEKVIGVRFQFRTQKKKTRAPERKWGQSPISFNTARSGEIAVLNWDLSPFAAERNWTLTPITPQPETSK